MFINVLVVLIGIWSIYTIIPTIYYKYIYKTKYKRGHLDLTFDDGPNPETTPQILEILNKNNKIATFFIVGEKALENPEIVKGAYNKGHKIGIHCYNHTHPLFWGPLKTKKDMEKSLEVFKKLEIIPSYYRPPHGFVNLSMIYLLNSWKLPLKLWTNIPGDWKDNKDWEEIYREIKREKIKGGIICLHDSNHKISTKTKANENTIKALEKYFKETRIKWKMKKEKITIKENTIKT